MRTIAWESLRLQIEVATLRAHRAFAKYPADYEVRLRIRIINSRLYFQYCNF